MLKVYPDTVVYVCAPFGVITGGVELLHQLASYLCKSGINARMVYYGHPDAKVPNEYSQYNLEVSEEVVDDAHNIEVIGEAHFNKAFVHTKIQKLMWWMSVDNYFVYGVSDIAMADLFKYNKYRALRELCSRIKSKVVNGRPLRSSVSLDMIKKQKWLNVYQSEYAHDFLLRHGFETIAPLKDYINCSFIAGGSRVKQSREDIVLYNPAKGYLFTKQLIDLSPDINWVPIKGYKRSDLIDLMSRAKLYVDFGNFPGKDRLPRECALSGLCIITGRNGAANYYEDVPIPSDFKFDIRTIEKQVIVDRIRYVIKEYDSVKDNFNYYRFLISREEDEFYKQVENIFSDNCKCQ